MTLNQIYQLEALISMLAFLAILAVLGHRVLEKNHEAKVPEVASDKYDDLPPGYAVMMAWSEAEATDQRAHHKKKELVRSTMPDLARALDRMVEN